MILNQQRGISSVLQPIRTFLKSQNYLVIFLLILAVVAIRLPIDFKRIMTITNNDYTTHIYFALDMLQGREVPAFTMAHSFYQLSLLFMWWASRSTIDFWHSAISFQVVSAVASTLVIYFWYGALPTRPSPWIRAFWAVTLVIVTPVVAPWLLDGAYYFGYIGLANYHNPTIHLLRPFAVLMFILGMEFLECPRSSLRRILFAAVVFSLATFLKPSYSVTLLPAVGLMGLYWLWKRRPLNWGLAVWGMGLPAVLILAAQFLYTYTYGEPEGGIALRPFLAASMLSAYLPLKFFLSIFFPLVSTALFFQSARKDHTMMLAWLAFAVGALQFYLFVELGSRFTHGNFVWGAQITLFMLFVVTIRFLLKQPAPQAGWASYAVYLPHVLCGVAYYLFCYFTPFYG